MGRSTVDAWLNGPGDLQEAVVEDVPVEGQSVLVRGLAAGYSNQAQSEATELKQVGRDTVVTVNGARLEVLQFAHGVIEPKFTVEQAEQVSQKYGSAFRRVIEKIDSLSALDKEAITQASARFPGGGAVEGRADLDAESPNGGTGSDLPPRTGAAVGEDRSGADDG